MMFTAQLYLGPGVRQEDTGHRAGPRRRRGVHESISRQTNVRHRQRGPHLQTVGPARQQVQTNVLRPPSRRQLCLREFLTRCSKVQFKSKNIFF